MTNSRIEELVLEYGPEGNVEPGKNCPVYELEDRYIKICEDLEKAEATQFKRELDNANIFYPETEFYTEEISYYGIGEVVVAEQDKTDPILHEIMEDTHNYVNEIRELGLKAAAHDIKLDLSLDNLCVGDDELGTFDINDPESVWTNEHLALHLMGSHLLNSVKKLERVKDFYAPELREMAENWKNTT